MWGCSDPTAVSAVASMRSLTTPRPERRTRTVPGSCSVHTSSGTVGWVPCAEAGVACPPARQPEARAPAHVSALNTVHHETRAAEPAFIGFMHLKLAVVPSACRVWCAWRGVAPGVGASEGVSPSARGRAHAPRRRRNGVHHPRPRRCAPARVAASVLQLATPGPANPTLAERCSGPRELRGRFSQPDPHCPPAAPRPSPMAAPASPQPLRGITLENRPPTARRVVCCACNANHVTTEHGRLAEGGISAPTRPSTTRRT